MSRRIYGKGAASIVAVVLMMVASGCSTPGTARMQAPGEVTGEVVAGSAVELRALPESFKRKAIAYSGYREGQSPDSGVAPSEAEVLEDLRLLEQAGFGLIRVYSSRGHGRMVVEVIDRHGIDLRVKLGAYLNGSDAEYGEDNLRELNAAVDLANRYRDVVAAVSVGNEVLVSWSFVPVPPEDMIGYLRYVRERISQPLTVNDNWEPYALPAGHPKQEVWRYVDFAAVHTYAYWDAAFRLWPFEQADVAPASRARAMVDAATAYAAENFSAVRAALDAAGIAIPIVIGETGWQNIPSATLDNAFVPAFASYLAHPVNQAWYANDMFGWAYGREHTSPGDGFSRPAALFYFAAFDEPWKQADDNWGLWDVHRQPKFVIGGAPPATPPVHFRQGK